MARKPTYPGRCPQCSRTLRLHADRLWTRAPKPGVNTTRAGFRCPACRITTVRFVDVEERLTAPEAGEYRVTGGMKW